MSQQNPIPDAAPVQGAAKNQPVFPKAVRFDEHGRVVTDEPKPPNGASPDQLSNEILRRYNAYPEILEALRQCDRYIENCTYIEVNKAGVLWPEIDEILGRLEGGAK